VSREWIKFQAKLGTGGRITVRKEICESMGLEEGDLLDVRIRKVSTPDKSYFVGTDGTPWKDASIDAGEETKPVTMKGDRKKIVYFLSDTPGTLKIQVFDLDRKRKTFDAVNVRGGSLCSYVIPEPVEEVALRFNAKATVTAWYKL